MIIDQFGKTAEGATALAGESLSQYVAPRVAEWLAPSAFAEEAPLIQSPSAQAQVAPGDVGLFGRLNNKVGVERLPSEGQDAFYRELRSALAFNVSPLGDMQAAELYFLRTYGKDIGADVSTTARIDGPDERQVSMVLNVALDGDPVWLALSDAVALLMRIDADFARVMGAYAADVDHATPSDSFLKELESEARPTLSLQQDLQEIDRREQEAEYQAGLAQVQKMEEEHKRAIAEFQAAEMEIEAQIAGLELKIRRETDNAKNLALRERKRELQARLRELQQQRALEHARDIYNSETKPFIPQLDGF